MGANSKIEWTEHTWNPVTGCTKISPGCKNCYAETMAARLQRMGVKGYEDGFKTTLHHKRLDIPRRRRVPTTYFVNSMSDLFHPNVPDSFIDSVFDTIAVSGQHRFQILTKRAMRMAAYTKGKTLPPNAWLGVSVENKRHGVPRISHLQKTPAVIRFLSVEPLIEDVGLLDLEGIHWVIVGGESGARARPVEKEWIQSVRDQCRFAKVPFFFKQWGGRTSKSGGRTLDGAIWNEMPKHESSEGIFMGA